LRRSFFFNKEYNGITVEAWKESYKTISQLAAYRDVSKYFSVLKTK